MGTQLLDQYSLLHFAVGVVMYFVSVPLWTWNLMHTVFEILENTKFWMYIINNYLTWWPGGKPYPDLVINSVGDVISGHIGWSVAEWLDGYGSAQGWYSKHLP